MSPGKTLKLSVFTEKILSGEKRLYINNVSEPVLVMDNMSTLLLPTAVVSNMSDSGSTVIFGSGDPGPGDSVWIMAKPPTK